MNAKQAEPVPSAYLIVAHGSREPKANESFQEFLERFRRAYPNRVVQGACLEIASPDIPQAVDECVKKGCRQIFVLPLMFFPGRHVKEDIPALILKAKERHPDIDFHYAGCLADHPGIMTALEDKAKALAEEARS